VSRPFYFPASVAFAATLSERARDRLLKALTDDAARIAEVAEATAARHCAEAQATAAQVANLAEVIAGLEKLVGELHRRVNLSATDTPLAGGGCPSDSGAQVAVYLPSDSDGRT